MRDLINIINESQNNPLTKSKKMTLSEYIQQQDIPEEKKMKLIEMAKDYDIIKPSKNEKKHYDSLTFSQFVKEIYDTYGYIHIMGSGGIHWLNIKGEIFEYCHEHGLHTSDITAIPYRGDYFIFDNSSATGQ